MSLQAENISLFLLQHTEEKKEKMQKDSALNISGIQIKTFLQRVNFESPRSPGCWQFYFYENPVDLFSVLQGL